MEIKNCESHGLSPIPQEGNMDFVKDIYQISGLSHGIGSCAPQQGACKLTLNVKKGIIEEALVEVIGCTGMTQSAAMAGEILTGKTILEACNTDLVCDAINSAMKNIFLQLIYGRTQSAFSENGLKVGSALEDLGKDKVSAVGTIYSSKKDGTRYLNTADGYISRLALDKNKEIIGYEYVNSARVICAIQNGIDGQIALKNNTKTYGRFADGITFVNPRSENE